MWAQATVLTLHTTGMAVLVGASWVLDLRLLGISRNIPLSAFRWVFRAVAIGLIVNVVTGVLLFIARAETWGTAIPFLVKMSLVIAASATLVPIRSHVFRREGGPVPPKVQSTEGGPEDSSTRLLAIASIVMWAAAITAGRLLAYLVPG